MELIPANNEKERPGISNGRWAGQDSFLDQRKFEFENIQSSGAWINIKLPSYQYRKSHCGEKTILRPSYLHNGISYTGKMTSLYWIRALGFKISDDMELKGVMNDSLYKVTKKARMTRRIHRITQ